MIVVIADDFTGAAELAGISLRYGLKTELFLGHVHKSETDVLIVCTNSRSLKKKDALTVTASVIKEILRLKPSFIYKKIDSVLRGYVTAEAKLQMELTGKTKALIIPANPSLNRTISNGEYFIDGKRINETGFVNDPEFPVKSSFIAEILMDDVVKVIKETDELPGEGLMVGEAKSMEEVDGWVKKTDKSFVLIGAGDFFTAILKRNFKQEKQQEFNLQSPFLYVCGTAFEERKQYIRQVKKELGCVSYLPEIVTEEWLDETCRIIEVKGKLIIAIDESPTDAVILRIAMANAVKKIVQKKNIKEIFIEGGSTAATVLAELNIDVLQPINELSRGVVRMSAGDLFITVKPGSYLLPEIIESKLNTH